MKTDNFMRGLRILETWNETSSALDLHAEHDMIYISGLLDTDVSQHDRERLESLGFSYTETDGWYCFV